MTFKDIHQISYEDLREFDKILIVCNIPSNTKECQFKLSWVLRMVTKGSPCIICAGFDQDPTFPVLEDILDLKYHHSYISSELLEKCAKYHATVIVNLDCPFDGDVEFYDGEKYIFLSDRDHLKLEYLKDEKFPQFDCIIYLDSRLVYMGDEVKYYVDIPTTRTCT